MAIVVAATSAAVSCILPSIRRMLNQAIFVDFVFDKEVRN